MKHHVSVQQEPPEGSSLDLCERAEFVHKNTLTYHIYRNTIHCLAKLYLGEVCTVFRTKKWFPHWRRADVFFSTWASNGTLNPMVEFFGRQLKR